MLLSFDLAGADWITTAYCCRDPAMLEVARSKKSPHPITGSRMTGLTPEDVLTDNKLIGSKIDPTEIEALRRERLPHIFSKARFLPRTMSIRQAAKKANHGLNFREGYKTFALKNEIEEREARQIVDLYRKKAYPGLIPWYTEIDETIRKTRTLTNCFGRKVYFQGALNDDTFRAATSFIPQSTTFDVCREAMVKYANDDTPDFEPTRMAAQVHDSLIWDYMRHDWPAMARFCQKIAFDYMSPWLEYRGERYKLDVTLKAGMTWGALHEIAMTENVQALAEALHSIEG